MRKLSFLVVALVMLIALPVSALDLGKLTLTVQPVDYVSALAGIAKPVSKSYAANERYAVAAVPRTRGGRFRSITMLPTYRLSVSLPIAPLRPAKSS